MIEGWSEAGAVALLASMRDVAGAMDEPHQTADRLIEGCATHVFGLDGDLRALPTTDPNALATALPDGEQRELAIQFLVLVPYACTELEEPPVGRVEAYATALGVEPKTLHDLNAVRRHHVKRLLVDYSRRAMKNLGNRRSMIATVITSVHQYVGAPKVAARYQALERYGPGTLGRTFFDFYRARAFPLPGEHKSLGETLVGHDCCHILSGFNTDGTGEIDVAGFEAGMKKADFGFEMLMEVLLDFQLGVDFGVGLAGYVPKVGELDPDQLMVGIERGLGCNTDLLGDSWDFWSVADRPVTELRDAYGIVGVEGIDMPAPEHPATGT